MIVKDSEAPGLNFENSSVHAWFATQGPYTLNPNWLARRTDLGRVSSILTSRLSFTSLRP